VRVENAPKIYQAMCDAMADIHAVAKEQQNVQQKFRYRGIDDAMNALSPILKKHRLFLVPEVLAHEREERQTKGGGNLIYSILRVKYSMYTDDGSCVSAVVVGEGMDSGDKATNKAMSIAFKYACFQVFCIPTEEMKDPDSESHDVTPITKKKIGTAKINSITRKCESDGVKPEDICVRCNVKDLSELTEEMYAWICNNWSAVFKNGK
jgi:hypothetical protein